MGGMQKIAEASVQLNELNDKLAVQKVAVTEKTGQSHSNNLHVQPTKSESCFHNALSHCPSSMLRLLVSFKLPYSPKPTPEHTKTCLGITD